MAIGQILDGLNRRTTLCTALDPPPAVLLDLCLHAVNPGAVAQPEEGGTFMLIRAKAALGLTAAGLVLGLTGTLAGATIATAAPAQQVPARTVSTRTVTIQAVDNLGLTTSEAKSVQCYVRGAGYDPGTIDGRLGHDSWLAWQRFLNADGDKAGTEDGILGPNTISALQRFLTSLGYDTGGIDGKAGTKTRAAWKAFSHLGNGRDGSWC